MDFQAIIDRLEQQHPGQLLCTDAEAIDPWVEVSLGDLLTVAQFLRDDPTLRMNMLHCITAVDYLETASEQKKDTHEHGPPRVEMLYHLSSLVHGHRLVLKVTL